MLEASRIALNRIAVPRAGIGEFFVLASDLGLGKVELRNDLPGGKIVDGLEPARVRDLAARHRVRILTINALQKFNLPSHLADAARELEDLLALAGAIGCGAVVLCPNNDRADARTEAQSLRDTTAALKALRPRFEAAGILGYVEPLGFPESSLRSLLAASRAVEDSGASCYRLVYDTFHHHLGPDTAADLARGLDVRLVGLVHASGVEAAVDKGALRDGHRVLVTARDRVDNVGQLARLAARGYAGDVSLEPFSGEVQDLDRAAFIAAARETLALLAR